MALDSPEKLHSLMSENGGLTIKVRRVKDEYAWPGHSQGEEWENRKLYGEAGLWASSY